jgi:hypothetical protein
MWWLSLTSEFGCWKLAQQNWLKKYLYCDLVLSIMVFAVVWIASMLGFDKTKLWMTGYIYLYSITQIILIIPQMLAGLEVLPRYKSRVAVTSLMFGTVVALCVLQPECKAPMLYARSIMIARGVVSSAIAASIVVLWEDVFSMLWMLGYSLLHTIVDGYAALVKPSEFGNRVLMWSSAGLFCVHMVVGRWVRV